MEHRPLQFALVGCGRISQKHVEALIHGEDTHLRAVCDVDLDQATSIAAEHGIRAYADMHEMMQSEPGVDVVSVLTPSGLHASHVVALAPYGRHIVVEKPMALRVDDADAMIEACDRYGVRLFVVKQNRYNLPVRKLREALEAGRFGRLLVGTVRVRWCRRQDYYDLADWRGTWALDGGVFANQASHHLDLLQWMFGPVESVFCEMDRFCAKIEAYDTGVALMRFRSGAIGVAEATTCTRPTDLEGSLSVLGERGVVEIGGFAVNRVRVWQFEDPLPTDEEVIAGADENPPSVYGFGHRAYIDHVVHSIRHGKSALVDGLEGRKSVELIEAIAASDLSGTRVQLPVRANGVTEGEGARRKRRRHHG